MICLSVTQGLVNDWLFKVVQDGERLAWRLRTADDARKSVPLLLYSFTFIRTYINWDETLTFYRYRSLTSEQCLVFNLIDEAGSEGMWTKTIKTRSNLHDAVFRSALKHLETKSMIADMKSVEYPLRKMYIKASTRPSERTTGGSWYTDSEMDEEFIRGVCRVIVDFVWRGSFYHSSGKDGSSSEKEKRKKAPKKGTISSMKKTIDHAKAERALALSGPVAAAAGGSVTGKLDFQNQALPEDDFSHRRKRYENMLPMPPGYLGYPTLTDITSYIDSHPVTNVTLAEQEIEQLMEILCFDDVVEKVDLGGPGGGIGYEETAFKATRRGLRQIILGEGEGTDGNGFTSAPCGRCPVFEICEVGGPVNPGGCEYFRDWLKA